eukprot:CAMPEP_0185799232 /NCGR_PEP_ID=MMETSP1322-20130828/196_1 /TAXON_ID=265543 /ORGANISM="Minutocellus polymorphus, Strain RCC2270" /LENGTH=412 /DNA_ID=CAMNT_0028494785 /DNA_START=199 /DNA_END=1437 /DNA_ORIENTATION=+
MQTPFRLRLPHHLLLLCAAYVAYLFRGWTWEENFIHNVLKVFPALPPVDPIRGRDVAVQVDYLAGATRNMEVLMGRAPGFLMQYTAGPEIAAASFGPAATKVVRINATTCTSSSGDAPPMTCTCPHDAGTDDTLPLVLYFHSGGMIVGSVDAELHYARYIAREASAVVCSVKYRKAPAHRLSDVLEDVVGASAALLGSSSSSSSTLGADLVRSLGIGGIDTSRAATFGISAGGYLAAMVPRHLAAMRQEEKDSSDLVAAIRVQISMAPMVRPLADTPSMVEHFHDAPDWSGDHNTYAWSALLARDRDGDGTQACDWQANLMADLPKKESGTTAAALPPAYVVTATKDILRDEGRAYAEQLRIAGRLIEHVEYNTNHGGLFPELSRRGPADQALSRAVQVLSDRLNGGQYVVE